MLGAYNGNASASNNQIGQAGQSTVAKNQENQDMQNNMQQFKNNVTQSFSTGVN